MKTKTEKLKWSAMSEDERKVLIAEKVFGWKKEKRRMYGGNHNVSGWGLNRHLSMGHIDRKFNPYAHLFDDWTTSVYALQQAKEKFPKWEVRKYDTNLFQAIIWNRAPVSVAITNGPTECEAFCKAALRSKGIETPNERNYEDESQKGNASHHDSFRGGDGARRQT